MKKSGIRYRFFVILLVMLFISIPGIVNAAPDFNKWINPSANNSIIRGVFNVTVNITDATGVDVSLINFNNSNFTMNRSNDLFYFIWNTSSNADAIYNITIFFNNTIGLSNTNTLFNITVNNTNRAPNITSTPVTKANERVSYTYDVDATDPDEDTLTFNLTLKPEGMTVNSATGLILWTPTTSQLGSNNVTVIVSDGNLTANQSFEINVSKSPRLVISDLDVKVDGKTDKNLNDGDKINKEATPGSIVEFKLKIENLFTDEEDLEIEDIDVEITIEDIDDGDDLDEDAKEFDLNDGKNKKVNIEFKIPLEVDEGIFDVIINIEGEDENGTTHEIRYELQLEVKKERHEIRIIRAALTPSMIKCQRQVSINTEIINTGSKDEDEVTLEITAVDLGINSLTTDIELEEGTDDNRFTKLVTESISADVASGIYPILINIYYNGKLSDSRTVDLIVEDCELVKEVKKEVKEEKPEVEVIKPKVVKKEQAPGEVSFAGTEVPKVLLAILIVVFIGTAVFVIGAGYIVLKK